MANADEIASLIIAGMAAPAGPEDGGDHTGVVITWDAISGVNTVSLNGTVLSNLKSLQLGIGVAYDPGDVVLIRRKQSQYYVVGKVAAPNTVENSSGSAALGAVGASGNVSTAGSWTGIDGGVAPPTVTVRIGSSAIVSFGVARLNTNNSEVEVGLVLSGSSSWAPGSFAGQGIWAGNNNYANGGPMAVSAPSKTLFLRKNTGNINGYFRPGVTTFTLQYKMTLYNNGTGVGIGSPWISVIPF